eukprot:4005476-Prymnesium_polylepis.1
MQLRQDSAIRIRAVAAVLTSGRRSEGTSRAAHAHRSAPVLPHNPLPRHSGGSCPGAVTSA